MGRKLDKVMADMQAELNDGTETTVTETVETPVEPSSEQEPAAEPDPEPAQEPEQESEPVEGDDKPDDKQSHRDIPDDPVKRAEFSFRRQLAKKDEKHAKELADRDAKYAELEKKFAELEKKVTPKEPDKTRDDFSNDEDFLQYLSDKRFDERMAKYNEEQAAKEAERKKEEEAKAAEQEELARRQQEWLDNVNQAFNGDKERSTKFFDRVAFCRKQGLDEVLDGCPVAADYLINDPMGPLVFEKMVNDKATFERIFNPRRLNPMAIYHELRSVEDEITRANAAPAAEPPKPVPHLGRPGRQSGGSSIMSTDMFSDNRSVKQWLREHR